MKIKVMCTLMKKLYAEVTLAQVILSQVNFLVSGSQCYQICVLPKERGHFRVSPVRSLLEHQGEVCRQSLYEEDGTTRSQGPRKDPPWKYEYQSLPSISRQGSCKVPRHIYISSFSKSTEKFLLRKLTMCLRRIQKNRL